MSKCHIVGNHVHWLNYDFSTVNDKLFSIFTFVTRRVLLKFNLRSFSQIVATVFGIFKEKKSKIPTSGI